MRELLLEPLISRVWQILQEFTLIKAVVASIAAALATFIESDLDSYLALIALTVIDQITGVAVAWKRRNISSAQFRRGLTKVFVYTVIVAAFFVVEKLDPILESLHLDTFAILYLGITEMMSILENLQILHPALKLPPWVYQVLRHFKKDR